MIEFVPVCGTERTEDLDDQTFFHRGELRFDAARHVEPRRPPFFDAEVRVGKHRRNRNEKKIRSVAANDDGGANLAAFQIRERNRKENNVIS